MRQRPRELPVNAHHIRLLKRRTIGQGRNVLKNEWNVEAAPPGSCRSMRITLCTGSTIGLGRNVLKSEWIAGAASPGVAGQCATRAAQEAPSGRGELFLKASGMLRQRPRSCRSMRIMCCTGSTIGHGRNVLKSESNGCGWRARRAGAAGAARRASPRNV